MNAPVVWDGSYHFPLPNGEILNPSFLPSFIDCEDKPLVPIVGVDLALYDNLGGKPGSIAPTVSGMTVSYDTAAWGGFPVAYSEGCGAWIVDGNDLMIGHGSPNGCDQIWNTIADVAAWLTGNDPFGLVWVVNGTLVEATSLVGPNEVVYRVATCDDLPILPNFIDCDGNLLFPQDIEGSVVDQIAIPEATFLGSAGTSEKIADLGGGVFTYESSFGTIQEATDLFAMMNALIADPVSWVHEVIAQGNIVVDWPHGSITNPVQNANAIRYTLNVSMVQITPAPSYPFLTNPPPSNFALNKAALLAAYQSQPIGQVFQGSDFTVELHTQVATPTIENAYQFVTCENLADALAALADNQVISSPNNTISVGASGPQAPDNQVDYKIDVNYVAGTTPAITSDASHPDAHSGKNSMYMGEPDVWLRIPWAASPTGFLVLPGYYQA